MRLNSLISAFLALAAAKPFLALHTGSGSGLPGFAWDGSRSSEYGVPNLVITFPDGQTDSVLLERHNPIPVSGSEREMDVDACIFRGKLLHNSQVPVAVTGGCPFSDSFEISIFSEKLSHSIYKVENGVVSSLQLPWAHDNKTSGRSIRDVALEPPQEPRQKASIDRALPPSSLTANVKLWSDGTFRARFGSDSVNTMRRVMAHAQNFYKLVDSLKTSITLNIVGTGEIAENISATYEDLKQVVGKYSTDASIHFNVNLCSENNAYGYVGQAWIGAVCSFPLSLRTSISEYFFSDAQTGGIVAHEMGHNLGMSDDRSTNGAGRVDRNNQTCFKIGGIMDSGAPIKWSTCSVEDFIRYYNRFSNFCLPTNTNPITTTTTTPTMSTDVICAPSWFNDTFCDDLNNNAKCNYDGGDCCNNPNVEYKKHCTVCACLNPV